MFGVLASVGWVVSFFAHRHYLPQPFLYVPQDTFMDWFNPAYWANNPGAYDVWHAIYPPISFVFLRIFSIHSCYGDPFNARDCDWIGIVAILLFYLLNCWLAFHIFRRIDRATAIPRGVAFSLGLPLLYCLERGNLILVCLPAFMYAYSGLARSRFWQALSIAISVNFKPYLVVPSFALAAKREWRALEAAGLLTIAVYLLSLALFGAGHPFQIIENMGIWTRSTDDQSWEQFYFSTSFNSLLLLLNSSYPILDILPSKLVERLDWLLPLVMHTTQLAAIAALAGTWLQPRAVSLPRIAALLTAVHMATQWLAGYGIAFLVFLVFLERERRVGQVIMLICAYLLSISYDWVLAVIMSTENLSWLSGLAVQGGVGLSVGQFLRPALILVIIWALAIDTLVQVVLAHRRYRPSLGFSPA